MNAADYLRKRDLIQCNSAGRSNDWRKRALKRLTAEARGDKVDIGGKVVAIRLPNGEMVCSKFRYISKESADASLGMILRSTSTRAKTPQRVYFCCTCKGWHLTSKP